MKSNVTNLLTKHVFARWLCITAILIIAMSLNIGLSSATDSLVAVPVKQIASVKVSIDSHKSCPFRSHSSSFGTCSSAGLVGLAQRAADQLLLVDPNGSRFVMTHSTVLTKIHSSPLERPPRP